MKNKYQEALDDLVFKVFTSRATRVWDLKYNNKQNKELEKARKLIQELVDKETPMKKVVKLEFNDMKMFYCPKCNELLHESDNYCRECGQKLKEYDWSDE